MTALVWFRRDLRLHDHPALIAALDEHDFVVPVFCLDDRLLHGRHASGTRTRFMLQSLADLDDQLRSRGARLVIRHGPPERELPELAARVGASETHVAWDVSPYASHRDQRVAAALDRAGAPLRWHPGVGLLDDPSAVTTHAGTPYSVFTPYYNAWLAAPRREPLDAPREVPMPPRLAHGRLPSADSLGLREHAADALPGGERAGLRRLDAFLADSVREYAAGHDMVSAATSSRLSAYLKFGCVSARYVEAKLLASTPAGDEGASAFRRQLCWRDFYLQHLHHNPGNARHEFQERYRDRLEWRDDEEAFTSWTRGRTGFPLVDAGMRQLTREGWMHNRARLVVGSFLTKDLGIDWRRGERWFMRWLIDGDEANNNGNWQWIASVGADPQPVFRRLLSPVSHQRHYDPDGAYVRRYVPELVDVPDEYLAEPWRMPAETQRAVGCRIGVDYPEPIIDHRAARAEALARYRAARADSES